MLLCEIVTLSNLWKPARAAEKVSRIVKGKTFLIVAVALGAGYIMATGD